MKIIVALVREGPVFIFQDGESSLRVDFSLGMETFALESAMNRIRVFCHCGLGVHGSSLCVTQLHRSQTLYGSAWPLPGVSRVGH